MIGDDGKIGVGCCDLNFSIFRMKILGRGWKMNDRNETMRECDCIQDGEE